METVEMSAEAVEDLCTAFKYNQFDTECYLDTESGEVVWFSADTPPVDGEPDGEDPEWVHEAYEKRMAIWNDDKGRFLEVPPSDIAEACADMAAFLEECDGHLAEKFSSTGRHQRAFETFKRTVERDPEYRREWRQFRHERVVDRICDWLELQGYELETA